MDLTLRVNPIKKKKNSAEQRNERVIIWTTIPSSDILDWELPYWISA